MAVTLVSPFPLADCSLLWSWLNEFPASNFDDGGPKSASELRASLTNRIGEGEQIWEVLQDRRPVGAIGYVQTDKRTGWFRGICFSQQVHGTGTPVEAVEQLLQRVFDAGTFRVYALYFADNQRVDGFLKKFGARVVETVLGGSVRAGEPVNWKVIEIDALHFHFRAFHESRVAQERSDRASDLPCAS